MGNLDHFKTQKMKPEELLVHLENDWKARPQALFWEQIVKAGYLGMVTRNVPASLNEE